jgi:hypothetical protein
MCHIQQHLRNRKKVREEKLGGVGEEEVKLLVVIN